MMHGGLSYLNKSTAIAANLFEQMGPFRIIVKLMFFNVFAFILVFARTTSVFKVYYFFSYVNFDFNSEDK